MEAFIARQPIFNRKQSVVAYELLFRGGFNNFMPEIDGSAATAKLLSTAFFNMGLDQLSARKPVWINFTQQLIEKEIPMLLPVESTVIELLEDIEPTAEVIKACRKFKAAGYKVALDDFVANELTAPLIEMADIIKIDVMLTSHSEVERLVAHFKDSKKTLLAEKVETYDDFQRIEKLGFDLFQGYFFAKPKVFRSKEISGSKLDLLQLLAEVNKPDFTFKNLDKILAHDVATSYKLMRYINSSLFNRGKEIKSVKQALVMLGQAEIRRFLSLVVTSSLAGDKPDELVRSACLKAQLCYLLAKAQTRNSLESDEMFTVGLFSNIDAILDQPIETVMELLPLQVAIKDAVVDGKGEMGELLNLANAYIRGRWELVEELAAALSIPEKKMHAAYRDACDWANEMV